MWLLVPLASLQKVVMEEKVVVCTPSTLLPSENVPTCRHLRAWKPLPPSSTIHTIRVLRHAKVFEIIYTFAGYAIIYTEV